nr:hypothetical protein GCM10025699_35630 [Microbacterium flavescens]
MARMIPSRIADDAAPASGNDERAVAVKRYSTRDEASALLVAAVRQLRNEGIGPEAASHTAALRAGSTSSFRSLE